MHPALQFLVFWVLAFVSLSLAVVLLSIYSSVIDTDATLHSLGKETTIAVIASLIEAASVWSVLRFVPSAARALVVPALIVALIYRVSHFEDWGRFDIIILLVFQLGLAIVGGALFMGQFQLAIIVLAIYLGVFGLLAAVVKSL